MRIVRVLVPLAFAVLANSQTPSFETASIRPGVSGRSGSSIHPEGGRVSMQNVSLKRVISYAYGIPPYREYRIVGPDWLDTERFDIDATYTAGLQVPPMMQALLAQRFKLVQHREIKQIPAYTLTVAQNGPKIHPLEDRPEGGGSGSSCGSSGGSGNLLTMRITMAKFADLLERCAGFPIVDATGLDGTFDLTLAWSAGGDVEAAAAAANRNASLFTALQEQLGLRLENGKGPVEVLVVDRIERIPTGN